MNHLSTFIERCEQTGSRPTRLHYQLVDAQIDAIVLAYQRTQKLSQKVKEHEMMVPLSAHQIKFMDLFESQCDQLKKEVTSTEFTVFKLRYLEIPREQKNYTEIAPLIGYQDASTPRRILKQVRLKFLKQLVESGLEDLYLKEIATRQQPTELSVSDILQAYEHVKKNFKNRCCRSKSKEGGGCGSFSTTDGTCF